MKTRTVLAAACVAELQRSLLSKRRRGAHSGSTADAKTAKPGGSFRWRSCRNLSSTQEAFIGLSARPTNSCSPAACRKRWKCGSIRARIRNR